jgi:16S rRNA (cytosine1402-N4)-methyltransferase
MERAMARRPGCGSGERRASGAAIAPIHVPVLLRETLEALAISPAGRYIDATVGLGGHAEAILRASGPDGELLGIDADPDALAMAGPRLAHFGERVRLVQGNFRDLGEIARREGFERVDGVLLDLGVSSLQFGPSGRGFTFSWDQPLDMRMDPALQTSARDIVNGYTEGDLAHVIATFGEERRSRAIARAIVRARPVETTGQLARTIEQAVGAAPTRIHVTSGPHARRGVKHPATRTFQALRIVVNRELDSLVAALRMAHDLLDAAGRLAVISYHSLEDRIVKEFITRASRDCLCPPRIPVCVCGHEATLRQVTRGAVTPTPSEVAANPRARSAKLRVAARLAPRDGTGATGGTSGAMD